MASKNTMQTQQQMNQYTDSTQYQQQVRQLSKNQSSQSNSQQQNIQNQINSQAKSNSLQSQYSKIQHQQAYLNENQNQVDFRSYDKQSAQNRGNSGMLASKTTQGLVQQHVRVNQIGNQQNTKVMPNSQQQMLKQDTSPMRVTLDLWDQNQPNASRVNPVQKQGSDMNSNQIYNSRGANFEGKFNQYLNQNNQISDQNIRNSRISNFNPNPPQSNTVQQNNSRFFQSPSLQNENYSRLNSNNSSQRPSQLINRQLSLQSNKLNQFDPNSAKYEQMGNQYSLETLIKQAQQKKLSTQGSISSGTFDSSQQFNSNIQQQQQQQQMYNFNNKIDNFEGDNDNVDEEYESSAEKRHNQQNQMQRYYDEGSVDSQENFIDNDNENDDQVYDEAEVESQQNDMHHEYEEDHNYNEEQEQQIHQNQTDDQNVIKEQFSNSNLSDEEQFNQLQDQLSSKKLDISPNYQIESPNQDNQRLEDSEYGFSSDSKYRLSMTPNNLLIPGPDTYNQGQDRQGSNRIFSDLSAKVVNINNGLSGLQNPFMAQTELFQQIQINKVSNPHQDKNLMNMDQDGHQTNYLSANSSSLPKDLIQMQAKQQVFQINSDVCNYESAQTKNLNYQSQIQMKQQEPFLQGYQIGSVAQNQTLDIYDQSRIQNISPFDLMKSEYLNKKQEVIQKYSNVKPPEYDSNFDLNIQDQKQNPQQKQFMTYDDKAKIVKPNIYQQLYQESDNVHIKVQTKQISNSTAQFFDQLKAEEQKKVTKQQKPLPENKFLTFDDFLNRDSIQNPQNIQKQEQQIKNQAFNNQDIKDNNVIVTKINLPISQQQSPRKNQLTNTFDKMDSQKTQVQNSRAINSKSPRPVQNIQQREKDQEIKKKREIEMLKQKAIEKEQMRIKRIESAIKIQKTIRGYFERKKMKKLQDNFRYYRKIRRLLSIAYGKYRLKSIQMLVKMMTQAHENKKMMEDEMFRKYVEHCVIFIQKNWKGYYSRMFVKEETIKKYKLSRALNAVVKGWKIRRILACCREVIDIKRDLLDIEKQFGLAKGPKDPLNFQIMQQRKKKIEELCKTVPNLCKKGRWVFSIQKKLVQVQLVNQKKAIALQNQKNQLAQSEIGATQNNQAQIMFNQTQNFRRQIDSEDKQQSKNNFRDQSPLQANMDKNLFSEQQNKRRVNQISLPYENNRIPSEQLTQRRLESVEDSSVVLWPSHRNNILETTSKAYDQINTDRNELQSDIPVTHRTAIADKIQNLDHNQIKSQINKPQFNSQIQQQSSNQNAQMQRYPQNQIYEEGLEINQQINHQNNLKSYRGVDVEGFNQIRENRLSNLQDKNELGDNAGGGGVQWLSKPNQNTDKNDLQKYSYLSNQNSVKKQAFEKNQSSLNQIQNPNRYKNFNNDDCDDYDNSSEKYNQYRTQQSNQKQTLNNKDFYPKQRNQNQYDQEERNRFEQEDEDFYEISNGYRNGQNKKVEDRPLQQKSKQNTDQYINQENEDEYDQREDRPLQKQVKKIQEPKQAATPINIDDIPIKPAKQNLFEEYINEDKQQQRQDKSSQKLKQLNGKNLDEVPIKPMPKKNPTFMENESDEYNSNQGDDRPIRGGNKGEEAMLSGNNQFATLNGSVDDAGIVPPKYDFEEMLEKAMQDQDLDGQIKNKAKKTIRRSKTTRPQDNQSLDEQDNENVGGDNGFNGSAKTTKNVLKKENLKKRQKYDPKKAIEEAKKREEQAKANIKSAFPEGILYQDNEAKTEDRIRSKTSQPKTQLQEDKSQENLQTNPKRKTMKQAETEKTQSQSNKNQAIENPHSDAQSTANGTNSVAADSSSAPKQFLKRKTQAVKFQKVEWKVRSRIDCWTNKGAEKDSRSNNQSQSRRKTSALRSPKSEIPIKSAVTSRGGEPKMVPPQKKNSQQNAISSVGSIQQIQHQVQLQSKSQNPSITNSFSQVPIQSLNLIQNQQMVQNSKSVIKLNNQHTPHQYQDETVEIESIPDENDQYMLRSATPQKFDNISSQDQFMQQKEQQQRRKAQTQWDSNIPQQNQMIVQLSGIDNKPQLQHFNKPQIAQIQMQDAYLPDQQQQYLSNQNFQTMMNQYSTFQSHQKFNNQTFSLQNNNYQNPNSQMQQDQIEQHGLNLNQDPIGNNDAVTLKLEELERVFEMFHPKNQTFGDCQIQDMVTRDTLIPHMTMDSMFFNCYSDDIYETILEELKNNYNELCNESYE